MLYMEIICVEISHNISCVIFWSQSQSKNLLMETEREQHFKTRSHNSSKLHDLSITQRKGYLIFIGSTVAVTEAEKSVCDSDTFEIQWAEQRGHHLCVIAWHSVKIRFDAKDKTNTTQAQHSTYNTRSVYHFRRDKCINHRNRYE